MNNFSRIKQKEYLQTLKTKNMRGIVSINKKMSKKQEKEIIKKLVLRKHKDRH